ncbi:MAG: UDP-N-acetylmuramate--L-alanine ligase [candidate division WOR-3 bacterium]|nr:UDP-N-acetylmuramate--L-alanine ligase [candidate division WOR-3 bacterium]MDW8150936.1 UDP-N-acetylmuramate--L-alanine ligase [candidate division WOR-3 bacterium]
MLLLKTRYKKIHFVGIGGVGMSGIAEVLHNIGFIVSGSDISRKDTTIRLENLGIKVYYEHSVDNVLDKDILVYSSAIGFDNPELLKAQELGIPIIPRAEMLAEIMRVKFSIAVSGAHGKTTTTSMIGYAIRELEPTIIVGGILKGIEGTVKLGKSDFLVAEADESDRSFLRLFPSIAVITNIDREHLDTYKNLIDIKRTFLEFANSVPFYGAVIINLDDINNRDIIPFVEKRIITYGIDNNAFINARNIEIEDFGSSYKLYISNRFVSKVRLRVPGIHNIKNSLSAIAVAYDLDLELKSAIEGLYEFTGVRRRFEIKGYFGKSILIDDYGHHPTEIESVINTARNYFKNKKLVVVFQPHRYTRTKFLYNDFARVLSIADEVILLPIYSAGEKPIAGVSSELIYNKLSEISRDCKLFNDKSEVVEYLSKYKDAESVIITLGAGDVYKIAELMVNS